MSSAKYATSLSRVSGLMAAYMLWLDLVPDGPRAITVTEQLFERELGPTARELVSMVARCAPSAEVGVDAFVPDPAESDVEAGEGDPDDAETDDPTPPS